MYDTLKDTIIITYTKIYNLLLVITVKTTINRLA